jgi:hypothetical protein
LADLRKNKKTYRRDAEGAEFRRDERFIGLAPGATMRVSRVEVWLKGMLAAGVSGAAGGVMTGLAAVGIDPGHFNLQAGIGATMRIGAAATLINAVIGVAAYLQKSPLPGE